MLYLIKYRLLSLMREKNIVYWSILFPIILGTLFYVSFYNISDDMEMIQVAMVDGDTSEKDMFERYLGEVEKDDSEIISIKVMAEKEAMDKLENGDVKGIFYSGDRPRLKVAGNSIESSILQSVYDAYNSEAYVYKDVAEKEPQKLEEILKSSYISGSEETMLTGKKVDGMIQYFFSLIAMECMFGGFIGFQMSSQLQPNVSPVGARRTVTPTHKVKQLAADTIVGFGVQYLSYTILIVYLNNVLKVELGSFSGKIMLIGFAGSLIGVSIGMIVGCISKLTESMKIGILITFGLFSSFLSGLMVGGIKGTIEQYCPIVNRINPSSLISDALYSISVYDDPARYQNDIIILLGMSLVLCMTAFFMTRRESYDSI